MEQFIKYILTWANSKQRKTHRADHKHAPKKTGKPPLQSNALMDTTWLGATGHDWCTVPVAVSI